MLNNMRALSFKRIILRGSLAIAFLITLALAVLLYFLLTLDLNKYKSDVERLVSEATEREFVIGGGLHLSRSIVPTLLAKGIRLGGMPGGQYKDMLSLEELELKLAILPILKGQIELRRISLINPKIFLEKDAKGIGNWVLGKKTQKNTEKSPSATEKQSTLPLSLVVNALLVKDADIHFTDKESGKTTRVILPKLTLKASSPSSAIAIDLHGKLDNLPIEISGTLPSWNTLASGKNYSFDLRSNFADIRTKTSGSIADPGKLHGLNVRIDADISSLKKTGEFFEQALPDVEAIQLSTKVTSKDGAHYQVSIDIKSGTTHAKGDIDARMIAGKPRINLSILSDHIDLRPLMKSKSAGEEAQERKKSDLATEKKEKLFPNDPLLFGVLSKIDGKFSVSIGELVSAPATLKEILLNGALENSLLNIEQVKFDVAGGHVSGKGQLNGKTTASLLKVQGKGIELGKLLSLEDGSKLTGGNTDLHLDIKTTGNSVAKRLANLGGRVNVSVKQAIFIPSPSAKEEHKNIFSSILGKLLPLKAPKIALECAVSTMNFKNGSNINPDQPFLGVRTDLLDLTVDGTINLAQESLDLGLHPKARSLKYKVVNLASLVRVGGSFAKPSVNFDSSALVSSLRGELLESGEKLLGSILGKKETSEEKKKVTKKNPCARI